MAKLVVALDTSNGAHAVNMAKSLANDVGWLKIGLELFTAEGPDMVKKIKDLGYKVFLDLKFYDIPNTVASATKSVLSLNVDMLTVHCQGGRRMCEAACEAALSAPVPALIFGVTTLTSFASGEMPGIDMPPAKYCEMLARDAVAWGLAGVVCSGWEAEKIKSICPCLKVLCPGIRPAGAERGDQKRVMTPGQAVRSGADYLVVGRPITQAADPAKAARAILEEMAGNTIPPQNP